MSSIYASYVVYRLSDGFIVRAGCCEKTTLELQVHNAGEAVLETVDMVRDPNMRVDLETRNVYWPTGATGITRQE